MFVQLPIEPDHTLLALIANEMVKPGQGARAIWATIVRYAPPQQSLEEILAPIAKRGWLLNNLFQLDSGVWRCSIRNAVDRVAYEFGDGASPSQAVQAALQKAGGVQVPLLKNQSRAFAQKETTSVKTGTELLSMLGIKPK